MKIDQVRRFPEKRCDAMRDVVNGQDSHTSYGTDLAFHNLVQRCEIPSLCQLVPDEVQASLSFLEHGYPEPALM
jgi:hypothetical protein